MSQPIIREFYQRQHHHTPPHFIRSPIAQAVMAALLAMPVAAWASGSGSCPTSTTTLTQATYTVCNLSVQGDSLTVAPLVALSVMSGAAVNVTAAASAIDNSGTIMAQGSAAIVVSGHLDSITNQAGGQSGGRIGTQGGMGLLIPGQLAPSPTTV